MKKLICVMLTVLMTLSLFAGCGASGGAAETGYEKNYKIAIVQQLDHSSLDEIRVAVEAELKALGEAQGIGIICEVYNGQNDTSILGQIGAEVAAEGYDAIIPIATLAAQYMVTATEGSNTPIVYAAISDPEAAGLTGFANVTGTSDALNTAFIMDMMLAVNPNIETVGLLYSNSEPNSQTPIKEAKEYLDSKGIAYIEKTGTAVDEVLSATSALAGRCDAVFTPTDNAIMNAAPAVAEMLSTTKTPFYTGADSFVQAGAFTTCGVNYTELGTKTAQMTMDILNGGEVGPYHVMDGGIITFNTDTAADLGLDVSFVKDTFSAMANTVVTVTTGE